MEIIQVVKRFGLCGGMEEYVFRLAEELSKFGHKVKVLCEFQVTQANQQVQVIQLGKSLEKPRWFSHVQFSNKVSKWLNSYESKSHLIHSHERIYSHHLTTVHSTLFNFPKKGLPSFRKYMNETLEKRELFSKNVKKIVPVSKIISEQIKTKFPESESRLSYPIPPGVNKINIKKHEYDVTSPVIGFMGKEWKRKGLPKVIEIWREIQKKIPLAKLCLAGFPTSEEVGLESYEFENVKTLGYVNDKSIFYEQIDILLHPAKKEAYGMVIAEASSLGIPVLCSNKCGAAFDNLFNVQSLSDEDDTTKWIHQVEKIFSKVNNIPPSSTSWKRVAESYVQLYEKLN